jgi:hypothetical protein
MYNAKEKDKQAVEPIGEGVLRTQTMTQEDEFVRSLVVQHPLMDEKEIDEFLKKWDKPTSSLPTEGSITLLEEGKHVNYLPLLGTGEDKFLIALRSFEGSSFRYQRVYARGDRGFFNAHKDSIVYWLSVAARQPVRVHAVTDDGKFWTGTTAEIASIVPFKEKVTKVKRWRTMRGYRGRRL